MADIRKLDRDPAAEKRTVALYRRTLACNARRWADDQEVHQRYLDVLEAMAGLEDAFPVEELYEFVEDEDGEC